MENSKTRWSASLVGDAFRRLLLVVAVFTLGVAAQAQNLNVSGNVVDENDDPVIGASVLIGGTSQGVATDIDGNFSLKNVPSKGELVVSFVGYNTQTVKVEGRTNINIKLSLDSEMLDEVVVVGYGTQKKSDVTGALSHVGSKELQSRPVSNAFEALQGKAAGVDITTSERPGTVGEVRIRGERSLKAGNTPLYVVDGVPLLSGSGIETLNPRDIESVDILKDASATA
ncbi:MAG: carboxypeptidase-like regulatory domain-containing protein, partial [Duncaniella sp.]|nr:carboxypeptidase-like regulatory domain-containing protein [Duncaniella sp.]